MSLSDHVISPARPYRTLVLTLVSSIVSAGLVWLYFHYTTADLQTELSSLREQTTQLTTKKEQLNDENTQLKEALMQQKQALAIQMATDQQLQEKVAALQNDLVDLNRELTFYQNITQSTNSSELQVRQLEINADPIQPNRFYYRVVITQGKKITKPISGTISVSLTGLKADKKSTIRVDDHPLHLRFVQVLDGQLTLAENYTPKTISVTLKQANEKLFSKDFNWQISVPQSD